MDKSDLNKPDSASSTSVYETATSGSSSSTMISSSTSSSEDSALQMTTSQIFKTPLPLSKSQEFKKTNLSAHKKLVSNEQQINVNYSSSSTSSSSNELPVSKKEAFTFTEKIRSDSIFSNATSLSESGSLEFKKHEREAAVKPLKASSNSTETIEIILREPSKRNLYNIVHPSSNASISADDAQITSDNLVERASAEKSEILQNETIPQIETPLTIKDSKSSVVSSIFRDSSEIEVKRKSLISEDNRTVQFSLQDADFQPEKHQEHDILPATLETSKSQHLKIHGDDSFEDVDSIESTNLKIGHVFVYMFVPPDGGYGWFICFISFLCQIVVDGIVYSVGILLPHIANDFNIQGSEVIFIASLQTGFYFLSGTVASALINKYGFRPVALTGALLSITFLTLATFSINLPMMLLFHSILGGPALSLIWVSSQLVIGYYFDKYRPIANGASCSGAGVGIMLFSFMNSVLVPVMGWRNLMRLHVAFLALVLLMAFSFVEVAPTRIGRVKEPLAEDTESESLDIFYSITDYSKFSLKVDNQEYPLSSTFETKMEKHLKAEKKPSTSCISCLQKCCPYINRYLERQRELEAKDEITKRYVIKQDLIEKHDFFYAGPKELEPEQQNVEELLQKDLIINTSNDLTDSRWRTLSLEEIDNTFKRNTIIHNLSSRKTIQDQEPKKYRLTYTQLKLREKRPLLAFLSPRNWLHPKIQKAFMLLFDFRLLSIMEFRILLLSAFLFPMGFNIPFVYSTVRAQIDASFAKLITPTIGFSNFAFRIASGFVAFKFREYTTYICGGGMFFGGLAVFVSAFYGLNVVWFQFLYALCYGMAPAFFSTLRAIIYVRALGLDKLTNAFGLTALAMGLGVFIGTTAGGILNDLTGSYTASFVFAGICICTAGALKCMLPYFIKVFKDKEGK